MLPRGRKPQFKPISMSNGDYAVRQHTINGWETSYDPDEQAWCIHAPDGRVVRRYSVNTPSGWRNLLDWCRRTPAIHDCH